VLRQAATRDHYNRARGVKLGDPDFVMSIDEQLASVTATTLDDLKRFHGGYWSANDARVSAVGAIPEGLDAAVEKLFGAWKKPAAPKFIQPEAKADVIPAARFDAIARDKTSAAMKMRVDFALNDRDPDYIPLSLAVHILGGGALENRLSVRIRQQAGLSYGVGASLSAAHFGDEAGLTIAGTFAPQNREQMLTLVREELERLTRDGVTASELERAKKDVLEGRRQARASDGVLASALITQADQGETWAQSAQRDAAVQAATVEQVNQAWRKRIKLDGFVVSTVGDFKDKP
jgi:zinc protease